jgi:XTP/dITP diphosphohydrolase
LDGVAADIFKITTFTHQNDFFMKNQLVFATSNLHKIKEVKELLGKEYDFLSLNEIGCLEEVPETSLTIEANAIQKAKYVFEKYGKACIAEDTGLEVEALNGEPGVKTARYAGDERDMNANIEKLLVNLSNQSNRNARFKTVLAYIDELGNVATFEGICSGKIAMQVSGDNGFGYDPVFIPAEFDGKTFAEMPSDEKHKISHRARALEKLRKEFELF